MTTSERIEKRRRQLVSSVEDLAALDDFESLVREQERAAIAAALQDIIGNQDYSIGRMDPAVVREIARQIGWN